MQLLINDANILMDIEKLNLVDAFLSLGFDLHTTDFVFAELEDIQQEKFISNKLQIIRTESLEDYAAIYSLSESHNGLSFQDCSVWYYAEKLNGMLITGDGKLRKKATQAGLKVRGIIFIIEEIKKQKLLSPAECINKIKALKALNYRLPITEIDKIISKWENEII